jgi:hypothetical protein
MLDYWRAVQPPLLALVFFVSFMIIGQYMLFNLFLAILLQNFDEDSVEQELQKKMIRKEKMEKEILKQRIRQFFSHIASRMCYLATCKCCKKTAPETKLIGNVLKAKIGS